MGVRAAGARSRAGRSTRASRRSPPAYGARGRRVAAVLGPERFDGGERRAPDATAVDRLDAQHPEALRDRAADAGAGLLRDDRHGTLCAELADRGLDTCRPGLALGLHRLF